MATDANKETPIFLAHGDADEVGYVTICLRCFDFPSILPVTYLQTDTNIGLSNKTVPFKVGEITSGLLTSKGYNVTFKSYAHLGHWLGPDETQDMLSFLQQVIP